MIMDGCQGKPRTPTIREKTCPVCGNTIEIFSTDTQVACDKCGFVAYNDALSCVQWCQYARKCVGDEMYERMMEIARRQKAERSTKEEREMTVAEQKAALRKKLRTMERILPQSYRDESAAAICRRVTELPEYQAAKVVFAFVGTEREIDTTALLRDVLHSGRTLCLPRCGAAHSMALCHVTSLEQLKPGAYGILEPVEDCPLLTVGISILWRRPAFPATCGATGWDRAAATMTGSSTGITARRRCCAGRSCCRIRCPWRSTTSGFPLL